MRRIAGVASVNEARLLQQNPDLTKQLKTQAPEQNTELFLCGLDMVQIVPVVESSTWPLRPDADEYANELDRGTVQTVAYATRVISMVISFEKMVKTHQIHIST